MKRFLCIALSIVMLFAIASCATSTPASSPSPSPSQSPSPSPDSSDENTDENAPESSPELPSSARVEIDREGNPIELPDRIERIISMGPSTTEILIEFGFADLIIGADIYTVSIPEISTDVPLFSITSPDVEQILDLEADIMFVTSMSRTGDDDRYKTLSDSGLCLIYIPSSSSIAGIMEDIRFIAAVMDVPDKGEALVADMQRELDEVKALGETVTDKKSVYFEIAAAPYMYSFGHNTFLNEMIEIIGATNIFGEVSGWMSVSDEAVLDADPDVILTSVDYIDDPIEEIKDRSGWSDITAVKNDAVYKIHTDRSTRSSHKIVIALREMAEAIYPELTQ